MLGCVRLQRGKRNDVKDHYADKGSLQYDYANVLYFPSIML